jgi:uncharacterized membrane protein
LGIELRTSFAKGEIVAIFSFKPSLTLKGRKFKGLRGYAGKPFHPPLTDIPVGAYVIAPILDVVSIIGKSHGWSKDFYHAATYTFIIGAFFSLFAALTGFWDWWKSTEKGNQARRTANAHMTTMLTLTGFVILNIVLRISAYKDYAHAPLFIVILSIIALILVTIGGTIGGGLTYDYGFNVETAGDSPVWHESETDVMPGEK